MGILGSGGGKRQVAGVFVNPGKEKRGLHRRQELPFLLQLTNHQGDIRSHFFLAAPGGSDVSPLGVMVPQQDFQIAFLSQFIDSPETGPPVDIDHHQAVDMVQVDILENKCLEKVLVDR